MARTTNLLQAVSGLIKGKFFKKRIQVKSTTDGMVALMNAEDGNAYIVHISGASESRFKNLFSKELDKK